MSWPHEHGGHRGDRRSVARGAEHGRIRWRWRADDGATPASPLALDDRIALVAGRTLWILAADGEPLSRIALHDGARLGLLAPIGPTIAIRSRVLQLDWTGATVWQQDLEQPVVALQRSMTGNIAVCTHLRGYPPSGRLVVLDPEGTVRWRVDDHAVVGARVDGPDLVWDDAGHLYSLMTGRLGDGVSGNDMLTGGCRGFDRHGSSLWPRAIGPEHPREIQASASGVVVIGMASVHAYDPHGVVSWEDLLDAGSVCAVAGLELVRSCARLRLPRILDRRPGGGGTICRGSYDCDDTLYFGHIVWSPPRMDGLLALAADDRLRWHLPLPAIPFATNDPVVGPNASLLLAHGDELIAVE